MSMLMILLDCDNYRHICRVISEALQKFKWEGKKVCYCHFYFLVIMMMIFIFSNHSDIPIITIMLGKIQHDRESIS